MLLRLHIQTTNKPDLYVDTYLGPVILARVRQQHHPLSEEAHHDQLHHHNHKRHFRPPVCYRHHCRHANFAGAGMIPLMLDILALLSLCLTVPTLVLIYTGPGVRYVSKTAKNAISEAIKDAQHKAACRYFYKGLDS